MTQFASPVLHSLLDTDAYKLHMQQAVFHHYYDVHVAAEFRCRGDDLLGVLIHLKYEKNREDIGLFGI